MGRRVHLEQPIHEEALALLRENAEVSVGFGPEARELDDALLAEVNALLVRTKPLGTVRLMLYHPRVPRLGYHVPTDLGVTFRGQRKPTAPGTSARLREAGAWLDGSLGRDRSPCS